jgi:PelA/Pel-15E family pectate lyase
VAYRSSFRLGVAACSLLGCAAPRTASAPPEPSAPLVATDAPAPAVASAAPAPQPAVRYKPIPLDGFGDGIRHYERIHPPYSRHPPDRIVALADNILLHQRDHGGWIENRDPTKILGEAELAELTREKADPRASFDNRNIYTQIEYLFAVYEQTRDGRYSKAALRGLEYLLAAQNPKCGGFPHTLPGTKPYHRHITFADDVTAGVLATLRKLESGAPPFASVGESERARARVARERGDACVLALQVRRQGKPSGWAGQYDEETLKPAPGRAFELVSLVSDESVGIVQYLMSIPEPSPEVKAAVEGAVAWLERSKLTGLKLETVELKEPVKFPFHTATSDRRLVRDKNAPPLWARFYGIHDNSVVLADHEGKRVFRYEDIPQERRTGYSWYGTWPKKLLDERYPAWKERVAR